MSRPRWLALTVGCQRDTDNTGSTTPSADVSLTKTLDTAGPYTVGQSMVMRK